ncbi:MAG TPA: dienelactone hydrolase family protein [Saprospiraceae bacterium]|nr:dienelactone hydrolase family protein [Saprospiraceae bacterium]
MKKTILILLSFSLTLISLQAQQVIHLDSEPNTEGVNWKKQEGTFKMPNGAEMVSNVVEPTLTAFLPDPEKANGTALIIAPGGGFHFLAINNEGNHLAEWCAERGIAAFVLRYRLVPTGENPMQEFMAKLQKSQEEMDREMAPIIELAKADGRAAIEYVRRYAEKFKVKEDQIGIIGFSAGGTVAGAAALEYSTEANRPDFAAPIYPALHVVNTEQMPAKPMPLFMAVTSDDVFGFQTLCTQLYDQWNMAQAPIELHIYERGGHGFGMRKQKAPSDQWIAAFAAWLKDHDWL